MKIQYVPLEYVHQTWPLIEAFIASALEYAQGDYSLEQAKTRVADGRWVLCVAVNDDGAIKGAACIDFYNRPNDRVAFIVAIGGRLISNQDTWQQLVALAKSNGATTIEGAARESIARLWTRYGFSEKYRIVGVKI